MFAIPTVYISETTVLYYYYYYNQITPHHSTAFLGSALLGGREGRMAKEDMTAGWNYS